MFHKPVIAWVVGLSCVAVIAAQPGEDAFRPLAKNHRWFELRGTANAQTSPLVRGALAAAFNDPTTAERLLRGVIRDMTRLPAGPSVRTDAKGCPRLVCMPCGAEPSRDAVTSRPDASPGGCSA